MEDNNNIEHLRTILEQQQLRGVSPAEAADIAESLISFFEVLGDESDTPETELIMANKVLVRG